MQFGQTGTSSTAFPGPSQISRNFKIWNLEIWKFGIQTHPEKNDSSARPQTAFCPDTWDFEETLKGFLEVPSVWTKCCLGSRAGVILFGMRLDPKFPDFQVPDFEISRNLAWAGEGGAAGACLTELHARRGRAWTLF